MEPGEVAAAGVEQKTLAVTIEVSPETWDGLRRQAKLLEKEIEARLQVFSGAANSYSLSMRRSYDSVVGNHFDQVSDATVQELEDFLRKVENIGKFDPVCPNGL